MTLAARVAVLEAEIAKTRDAIQLAEDFIDFTFDRARWEITTPQAQKDQEIRREQLGFLHACVTIWEKLGHETPDDIGKMVLALAGREQPKVEIKTITAGGEKERSIG